MRKRLLVLFAASALLLACDASSLVSQFLPKEELQEVLEEVEEVVETAAPTLKAAATSAAPTKAPAGATQPPTTKATATTGASTGDWFTSALTKARSASKYRIEFKWLFGGMEKGKYAEQVFIDFTGVMDGGKSHMTSKGGLLAMLAKDANTPIEIIEADGKTYMKGVSMFGMTDPKVWYITDDSATSTFGDFAKPDEFNDWTMGGKEGDFKKARSENVDGQSCDVYVYDMKSTQNAALLGLLGSAQNKDDFSAIDKGEVSFWLCKDGYVHKFLLEYAGHDSKDATQKAALKMTWHAWDFNNASLSVTVPKDAKPMPK